jgi:hypothetical protein
VAAPGTAHTDDWASLECGDEHRVIRWSVVGVEDVDRIARQAGLVVVERVEFGERWCVVLEEPT